MEARRTFSRVLALALSTTIGFASLTAAAAAIELTPDMEQVSQTLTKTASLSMLNHNMPTDGYNPMETAVADYVAKKQAEEAAKAAEAAAVQQAAAAAATAAAAGGGGGGGGNQSSGGGESYAAAPSNDEGDAWAILASYGLDGVSLSFGDAQGYEAIAYYKSGHIVINPNHTYPLRTLIAHEVNHIIAYRQSGKTTE